MIMVIHTVATYLHSVMVMYNNIHIHYVSAYVAIILNSHQLTFSRMMIYWMVAAKVYNKY